jgi:hypothetical protein
MYAGVPKICTFSGMGREREYIRCRLKQMLCLNSISLCDWSYLMVLSFYSLFYSLGGLRQFFGTAAADKPVISMLN